MDWLFIIEARLARWLGYADHCVRAETDLPVCKGFWTTAALAMAAVVLALLTYGIYAYLKGRRPKTAGTRPRNGDGADASSRRAR